MFTLGLLLLDGKEVRRDTRTAKTLLQRATENGHEEAADLLRKIKQKEVAGELFGAVAGEILKRILKD